MDSVEKIESSLNRAKAQLEQLCTSFHFSEDDIKTLAPKMAIQVREYQKQYNHEITNRAKDKEVTDSISINGVQP